jgi:hypothetical protein
MLVDMDALRVYELQRARPQSHVTMLSYGKASVSRTPSRRSVRRRA